MHIGDRHESLCVVARDLNDRLRAIVLSHFRSGPNPHNNGDEHRLAFQLTCDCCHHLVAKDVCGDDIGF